MGGDINMVFYTKHDLETQFHLYDEKLGLNLDGKTYEECERIIFDNCTKLKSQKEIRELVKENLHNIEKEYGFKALRLFMMDNVKSCLLKSYTRKNRLEEKYDKLIHDIRKYHEKNLLKGLKYTIEYYYYYSCLEDEYKKEYGVLKYFNNYLYSIIKTIHISNYKQDVINVLYPYLKNALFMDDGKYYLKKDLHDPKVLNMLYEHVAEENSDSELVKDYNILTEYDGYGNEYWINEYSKSWEDDTGYHAEFWEPEVTIDDYIKIGLPEN